MTVIATGVNKTVAFSRQTALNTIAGVGTGQLVRRVKSTLDLNKATFKSNEILVSQQRRDLRHGARSIKGVLSGELSSGTYQNFFESICRQLVQTAVTLAANITVTAAVTSGASGTLTITTGNFLTQGFKVGDLITMSGWTTTAAGNNQHYCTIIGVSATVMTVTFLDNNPMLAKVAGDSVTISQLGKKTWMPTSGQTRDYYTFEHWFSDAVQSEVFQDCVIEKVSINMPPTGVATVDFSVLGLTFISAQAQYFTAPTAQTTSSIMSSVNGSVNVNGSIAAIITAAKIDITGNYSMPGGIVGSYTDPDVFPGAIDVTGELTMLFQTNAQRDLFVNETNFGIYIVLSGGTNPNSTCIAFSMPNCKALTATKDDGEKGISLTMQIVALENVTGGTGISKLDTSFSVQDSSFA